LAPLSPAEAGQLAQLRLGEALRSEAASKLADTAGGNPLFIEQLAATMAESSPSATASLSTSIRGLPRAGRRERHARVAEFFEESTAELGESATALARHWRDAGDPERALGYFIRAGEQAEHGWAKDQAAILYREALDLVPKDDSETLGRLRRRLALARAATVHIPDARQLMSES
jgi:predicted ATPase